MPSSYGTGRTEPSHTVINRRYITIIHQLCRRSVPVSTWYFARSALAINTRPSSARNLTLACRRLTVACIRSITTWTIILHST